MQESLTSHSCFPKDDSPVGPVKPVNPVYPVKPVKPVAPNPVEPVGPVGPSAMPVGPVGPYPVGPVGPVMYSDCPRNTGRQVSGSITGGPYSGGHTAKTHPLEPPSGSTAQIPIVMYPTESPLLRKLALLIRESSNLTCCMHNRMRMVMHWLSGPAAKDI